MTDPLQHPLLAPLQAIHRRIRDAVVVQTEQAAVESLSHVHADDEGDTIYAIDKVAEDVLVDAIGRDVAREHGPVALVAEGLAGGRVLLPHGSSEGAVQWTVIVDPIDGTRGIMYQKRSAWVLTGVAPNRGPDTSLQDVVLAIQTEIPLLKQHLSDQLWAVRGGGITAHRLNRLTGEREPIRLTPSTSRTIAHGYATVSRFFPGARDELAAIDEEIVLAALGPVRPGKAHCFEDQFACSGGQLYELMAGHDRFVADLRPLLEPLLARRGQRLGICCHPYDVCTALIATEAGVIVTDPLGRPLDAPLTVDADVAWVGYANEAIRRQIEPLLQVSLKRRGWI